MDTASPVFMKWGRLHDMRWLARPLATIVLCAGVACTSAPVTPTQPASSPSADVQLTARGVDQSGRFRLVFEVPQTVSSAGEEIDGLATLELVEGAEGISGGSYLGFAFAEVDGHRRLDPAWTDNCSQRALAEDAPIESRILKTGAADDRFGKMLLADPLVRLSVGVWEITAVADFHEGLICAGPRYRLSATVRLQVTD
jgi:hypothetical protein